jgi:hypothetical protein
MGKRIMSCESPTGGANEYKGAEGCQESFKDGQGRFEEGVARRQ